ncbi:MAG: polysaccharide deacetylase family protein [Candidatus Omnitrophica bacterium]|nr:polysaccharide deacetylase family protein [Candidatus Omnitrophota bacterium]
MRKIMRKNLANIFGTVLYLTGFVFMRNVLRKYFAKHAKIRILFYHHVGLPGDDDPNLYVSPAAFERQMRHLKRDSKVISFDELMSFLKDKAYPEQDCVVITFDDGWKDNYEVAYPILKKYGFPATIFVATGLVGKKNMLTWEQILEMSNDGISFGAHSVTHPHLTKIDLKAAREEILNSKKELEEQIGKKVSWFAYPFGEFNSEIIKILKELDFECACSVINGSATRIEDLFILKRNGVGNFSQGAFAARLSGVFEMFPANLIRRLIESLCLN